MPNSKIIDLRSDTVTKPDRGMSEAMARAEVGDDVYGDDPTVKRLEAEVSARLGKESGVFLPTSTMANLIACLVHCRRGDEIILGADSHLYYYEQGGSAAIANAHPRPLPNLPDGTLDLAMVEQAIRESNEHFPITRLIALENTHNRCGGRVLRPEYMAAVSRLAGARGLSIHLDGARLWNAAAFLKVEPAKLTAGTESVNVCFSKGLGAPAGALLCASKDFIVLARRMRKVLGGAMRQSGVIAAACLYGLETIGPRLEDDHEAAKRLAEGISRLPGFRLNCDAVETNIVYFDFDYPGDSVAAFLSRAKHAGVLLNQSGPKQLRAVCHHQIEPTDIDETLRRIAACLDF